LNFHAGDQPKKNDIVCVTSPNNPDGEQTTSPMVVDILDGVYQHWVYGWNGSTVPNHCLVGSASKLLGMSGARVGWLLTDHPELAILARQFVEYTTSGVSVPSQLVVARALRWVREYNPQSQYQAARDEMMENCRVFCEIVKPYCSEIRGLPINGSGMFAFFKVKDVVEFQQALDRAKLALVTGEACGMKEPGWYRANMAQTNEYTESALEALRKELR